MGGQDESKLSGSDAAQGMSVGEKAGVENRFNNQVAGKNRGGHNYEALLTPQDHEKDPAGGTDSNRDAVDSDEDVLNMKIEFDHGTEAVRQDEHRKSLSLASPLTAAE